LNETFPVNNPLIYAQKIKILIHVNKCLVFDSHYWSLDLRKQIIWFTTSGTSSTRHWAQGYFLWELDSSDRVLPLDFWRWQNLRIHDISSLLLQNRTSCPEYLPWSISRIIGWFVCVEGWISILYWSDGIYS